MRDSPVLRRILAGRSDASIRFDDVRNQLNQLLRLSFVERIRGSHHLFRKPGVPERINIQRDGSHAKPYQIRQIRRIILKHKLQDED